MPTFVTCGGGSLGIVGTDAQLSARYGGGHHSGIVGGHDAVDRGVITDSDDRLGREVRIRAIHLEIAITHVERRRVLRGHYQVDAEPFGGAHEVGSAIGGAGKEDDHSRHGAVGAGLNRATSYHLDRCQKTPFSASLPMPWT